MTRLAIALTGFALLALYPQPAGAQHRPAYLVEIERLASDFPPGDALVWQRYRASLLGRHAAEQLARAPEDLETLDLLLAQHRTDDAVEVFRRIAGSRPERAAEAMAVIGRHSHTLRNAKSRPAVAALLSTANGLKSRLDRLPREAQARLARELVVFDLTLTPADRDAWRARLQAFLIEYAGTEAALLAEIDVIASGRITPATLQALDGFARAHAGTIAAAKALYQKAFHLAMNPYSLGERPGGDPTERFLQVAGIVRELRSGAYPRCEWIDNAPQLLIGFSAPAPTFAPGNIDRMLEVYRDIIRHPFELADPNPGDFGVGYLLTSRLPALLASRGDAIGGTERILADLERDAPEPEAVRYLRALFYFRQSRDTPAGDPLVARATDTLKELAANGRSSYARKALATLASHAFDAGDFRAASTLYRQFLNAHPGSAWAWVAALRLGQSEEMLGSWAAAATAYRDAAVNHSNVAMARILGSAYAARALEASGAFERALADYRRALDSWSPHEDDSLSMPVSRASRPAGPSPFRNPAEVSRASLRLRVAQLESSRHLEGASLLERGRWLLARDDYSAARVELDAFVSRHPRSPAIATARYLLHRARLGEALEMAGVAGRDAEALQVLDGLAREPHDAAVAAAKVARAAMLHLRNQPAAADEALGTALDEWRVRQFDGATDCAPGPLEQDVLSIRQVVFRPLGDGVFSGTRWNAFEWPTALPPFLIAPAEIDVILADGVRTTVSVRRPLKGLNNVLFLAAEDLRLLTSIVTHLGGTDRREPAHPMETPNQPIGRSRQLIAFFSRFFPARPGHWAGWDFVAYPTLTSIEFVDETRQKALARVTVGFAGATVVLEKIAGTWRAVELVDHWVT